VTTLATLLAIHEGWAWVVIIGNGMAGLWALGALRWPSRKAPQFHMFYGFVAIIAVGIIYSYRQQLRHRLYLLYGLGGLFIMGLGIRAVLVGQR